MNGYSTHIFEMHDLPGGLCTSWKRKGYTIDGCMHFLLGSNPGTDFYKIWEELGATQGWHIINQEEYMCFEGEDGQVLHVYTDIDQLEQHLKELAPEDEEVIEEVTEAARKCTRFEIPVEKARELYSLVDYIKMMPKLFPILRFMNKWGKISTLDLANRVKHPLLRQFLLTYAELPDYSMIVLLMAIAWHHRKHAGYAVGGSLEFARAIERRYLELGGEIKYKSKVDRILVENDNVIGIRLSDGTEHYGNIIISAADGRTTIFDLLQGKYINDKIQKLYNHASLFPPLIQIALGVNRSFNEVHYLVSGINYPIEEPVTLAGQEIRRLGVHVYNYDPGLAPDDKTVLKVLLNSDYDYWKEIRQDTKRYREAKKKIADQVISLLEQRFPGLTNQVEMSDVATPLTWERYTGNWRASHEGWLMTTKNMNMRLSKTLPGLKNFYMAGQWVMPGGSLPYVAVSGRDVIQIICTRNKKRFVATKP
jgi:phytoene dehydrogenase-like protein